MRYALYSESKQQTTAQSFRKNLIGEARPDLRRANLRARRPRRTQWVLQLLQPERWTVGLLDASIPLQKSQDMLASAVSSLRAYFQARKHVLQWERGLSLWLVKKKKRKRYLCKPAGKIWVSSKGENTKYQRAIERNRAAWQEPMPGSWVWTHGIRPIL